jgi:hypothetical protein
LKFVKRISILWAIAIAIAGAAAIRAVDLSWRRMERSETGRARWIWKTDDIKTPQAIRFRASKSIVIEREISSARAKIFVDRSYRLFLDGTLVGSGGQNAGDPLDVVDLSTRLSPGAHEIVIEAESPTGIGGILFGLDLSGYGRNAVVSDSSWKVEGQPVFVWGDPPMYPWRFSAIAKPLH